MAAPSASRSWARRALTTGVVAAVGLIALAIPASAHVPLAKAGCDGKDTVLKVDLTAYMSTKENPTPNSLTVVDWVGSKSTPVTDEKFGSELHKVFKPFDGKVSHVFEITVKAVDDPDGKLGFSKHWKTEPSKICDKTTTPPTSPSSSSSAVPPAPQPAPAPPAVGANGQLASTGASIGLPLAVGALLLLGGGVLLLVMRKRGKA